jgi:hypothetical protein
VSLKGSGEWEADRTGMRNGRERVQECILPKLFNRTYACVLSVFVVAVIVEVVPIVVVSCVIGAVVSIFVRLNSCGGPFTQSTFLKITLHCIDK